MRKNILIISHEFPPVIGGAGSVAETNATLLSINNKVTILTRGVKNRNYDKPYSIIEVYGPPIIFPIFYFFALVKIFWKENFDNIIINDSAAAIVCSLFFNKKLFRSTSIYFHGSEAEEIINSSRFSMILIKRIYLNAIKKSRQLIFVSNFLQNKILKKIIGGEHYINKSKVVYTLVDTKIFFPNRKSNIFKSISGKKIILTVSRVVEKKGLLEVAEILCSLNNKFENQYHWVLIGNGDYSSILSNYLIQMKNEKHFTQIEFVERDELSEFYSNANLFILLSNYEESFGLVYLESCLCGTPVIGKDKGGVNEVILDGINGFVVKNKDEALDAILNIENIDSAEAINYVKKMYNNFNVESYTHSLLNFSN